MAKKYKVDKPTDSVKELAVRLYSLINQARTPKWAKELPPGAVWDDDVGKEKFRYERAVEVLREADSKRKVRTVTKVERVEVTPGSGRGDSMG